MEISMVVVPLVNYRPKWDHGVQTLSVALKFPSSCFQS